MKKLPNNIKDDLEQILRSEREKNSSFLGLHDLEYLNKSNNLFEEYIASLSKQGYDVSNYKKEYHKIRLGRINK